jgi:hypothetical protein
MAKNGENNMKSVRLEATKYVWTAYAVVMGLMFGSSFFGYELGAGHIVLGIIISIVTFLSTGTVWNWGSVKLESDFMQADETSEKSKRKQSLDSLLDRLSDDELLDLREELRRSKSLSDGELMYQEKRR